MITPPAGGSPSPDIPNWAWHEYGNRVGFWRILKVIDEFRTPTTLAINGSAIAAYQPIARAARERNWEFIGHGLTQRNMQKVADEAADIARTTEIIAEQMQLLGSREGMGSGGGDDHGEGRSAPAPRAPASKPAAKSATGFDDMDDDIPF